MKTFEFESRFARRVAAVLALGLIMAAQTTMACTADNWLGGNSGNVTASGPDGPGGEPAIARYSGVCAMRTAADAETWVEDNSPGGIDRIRARFYVLADNTGVARIYRGLNAVGATVFDIALNPGNGNVSLISAGATAQCAGCANAGDWNSIEIDWDAGSGDMELVVNGGTPVSTALSSGETISAVRLGNLNDATGTMNFDAYESRRTTEIGRLCVGDGDGSGSIGFPDVTEIFNEVSSAGVELSVGQPDVDEDGSVGFPDVTQAFGLVSIAASCD